MESKERKAKASSCPLAMNRRSFIAASGVMAAAVHTGIFEFASDFYGKTSSTQKPVIRAAFVRPDVEKYWLGWPGAAYDIAGHQDMYTKVIKESADKLGLELQLIPAPICDTAGVNDFLANVKQNPPDGILLSAMSLNDPAWQNINAIAEGRAPVPMVVFSPMGTSFTQHLQGTRNISGVFTAATQDVGWIYDGMKLLRTVWQMKNSRICVVRGETVEDRKLEPIGTTLHYIPRDRFPQEFDGMATSEEMHAITDYYLKYAKMIIEPDKADVLNAVKNYFVARKIMADEGCDGISVDCLPIVGGRRIWPPCLAWSRLNDEGSVGCCEADWNAAISLRLAAYLTDRPGFVQDPAPNTVNNTLMGAHCSCPTKLEGFDKSPEPLILRSHSESNHGCSTQVLWKEGKKATIMKFTGPEKIILGTGKVVRNIDTPPSGGCRTSVELELDGVPDAQDTKGFHQLFMYGNLEIPFKAYAKLAGVQVEHI